MGILKKNKDEEDENVTIIKKELIKQEECEKILGGTYIEDVGCVVEKKETEDGRIFKKPSIEVIKKRPEIQKGEEE